MLCNSLKRLVVPIFVVIMLSVASLSLAAPTAPMYMPNFPMLAGDSVMLMWIPVPGAVKYKVYVNGKPIGEAPAPPYTTPAPQEGGAYKYTVTAVDASGAEGPHSKEGNIDIIKLTQPKGFQSQFLGDTLNLRWSGVKMAKIYDIYKSENKDDKPENFQLLASTEDTRYVDSKVKQSEHEVTRGSGKPQKKFYYTIVAKDAFGGTSPMEKIETVAIPYKDVDGGGTKDLILKIRRSKLVFVAKPLGSATEIVALSGALMLSDKETIVYTDPMGHVIAFLDKRGERIRTVGEKGPKPGQFGMPFKLGVDEDDNLYVSDSLRGALFAYDANGALLYSTKAQLPNDPEILKFYKREDRPFKFAKLAASVIYNGQVYIVEKVSGVIQRYDKDTGEFLGYFTVKDSDSGEEKIAFFPGPIDLLLDKKNKKLYVGCSVARKVFVVDIDTGEALYTIGSSKNFVGAFMAITGLAFTPEGDVLISDSALHTVQVFNGETGEYMYHMGDKKAIADEKAKGQRSSIKGLNFPTALNIDSQGRMWIYVGAMKGFMVREWINDDIWDASKDKSEE